MNYLSLNQNKFCFNLSNRRIEIEHKYTNQDTFLNEYCTEMGNYKYHNLSFLVDNYRIYLYEPLKTLLKVYKNKKVSCNLLTTYETRNDIKDYSFENFLKLHFFRKRKNNSCYYINQYDNIYLLNNINRKHSISNIDLYFDNSLAFDKMSSMPIKVVKFEPTKECWQNLEIIMKFIAIKEGYDFSNYNEMVIDTHQNIIPFITHYSKYGVV